MNIVILDGYSLNPGDLSWSEIESLGSVTYYDRTEASAIVERCKEADIVLTNKVPFSRTTIEQLNHLKFIAVLATGYNIIDTEAARERNIVVSNIPAYSTTSVVQATFALLLSITNRVEHYTEQITKESRWTKNADFCYWDTPLSELAGKRIGIYGFGQIGSKVASAAMAMGMEVMAYTSKPKENLPECIRKAENEEEFWSTCDVISLHAPLTPDTHHLVNKQTLSLMKSSAILLNTSRGPLIDEAALAKALENKKIAAFGADVLSTEPPSEDNPILNAPNVFLTPHIAWATKEARTRLLNTLIANVKAFIGGNPINVVN